MSATCTTRTSKLSWPSRGQEKIFNSGFKRANQEREVTKAMIAVAAATSPAATASRFMDEHKQCVNPLLLPIGLLLQPSGRL